jgi:hypothetical protein
MMTGSLDAVDEIGVGWTMGSVHSVPARRLLDRKYCIKIGAFAPMSHRFLGRRLLAGIYSDGVVTKSA